MRANIQLENDLEKNVVDSEENVFSDKDSIMSKQNNNKTILNYWSPSILDQFDMKRSSSTFNSNAKRMRLQNKCGEPDTKFLNGETGGEGDTPPQPLTPITGSLKSRSNRHRNNTNNGGTTTPSTGDALSSAKMNGVDFQNNNNTISTLKNERLSPASRSATTPDNSSRSRSVTPSSSSIPGTPPGAEHGAATISGRNYSDIMRSLAAKYNNSNPNEYFNSPPIRNGIIDPRSFVQNFKTNTPYASLLSPLGTTATTTLNTSSSSSSSSIVKDPNTTTESSKKHDNSNSLFPSPNNIPMFPPMIDMSSTQALLAIVRQAKQDELNKLSLKRGASAMSSSSTLDIQSSSSPLDLSNATPLAALSKRNRVSSKSTSALQIKRGESESPGPPTLITTASTSTSASSTPILKTVSPCSVAQQRLCLGQCASITDSEVNSWGVDDVVNFVSSIDICAEYAENFRDQRIDGAGLPLLTEDHLTNTMNMKLGPALKLKALLLRKMGSCALCLHCSHCHNTTNTVATSSNQQNHQNNLEQNSTQQIKQQISSPKPTDVKRPTSNNT